MFLKSNAILSFDAYVYILYATTALWEKEVVNIHTLDISLPDDYPVSLTIIKQVDM